MARNSDSSQDASRITVPRRQLAAELEERIAAAEKLLSDRPIRSRADLDATRSDIYTWDDYNRTLLKTRFASPEVEAEYSAHGPMIAFGGPTSLEDDVKQMRDDLSRDLRRLRSV